MSTKWFIEKNVFKKLDVMTRMGAVNSFFTAFADKTLTFEFNHLI